MPVQRVDGEPIWIVSTSGGESGWVDRASVRLLPWAVEYFDTLLTRDPRNWDAYLRRADVEHAMNLRAAATADYSRAIELHPNEAFLCLRRGRHYNTRKACPEELADFERAVELAPKSMPQDYNLVAELDSLESGVYFACADTAFRDYARGLALAKQPVAEDPSRATFVTILAAAYAQAGDLTSAVKTPREALARPGFRPHIAPMKNRYSRGTSLQPRRSHSDLNSERMGDADAFGRSISTGSSILCVSVGLTDN